MKTRHAASPRPAPLSSASSASVWRDCAFVLFWLAQTVSGTGTSVTNVVLPILVFQRTGSPLQTAILSGLRVVPYLLFGLVAGALADRTDRRRLMVGCNLLNTALLGSIPAAALLGALSLPQIYLVATLSATAFVLFDAANFGALPALVGPARIVAANSALWSTSTFVGIAGPALGGVLATTIGPAPAVTLDALSYAFSAATLLLIARPFNAARAIATESGSLMRRTLDDIQEGLRFLWGQPVIRILTGLGFGASFTSGAVYGLLVVYGVRALGLTAHDGRLGLLFATSALGALLPSLALPRLARRYQPGTITLIALALDLLFLVGLALAPTFGLGLVALLLWDTSYTLVVINGIALRQRVTPERLQSRVNATARMIAWGGTPFGAALGGALAQVATVRVAYLTMAGVAAATLAAGLLSPLRERRGGPTLPQDTVT